MRDIKNGYGGTPVFTKNNLEIALKLRKEIKDKIKYMIVENWLNKKINEYQNIYQNKNLIQ